MNSILRSDCGRPVLEVFYDPGLLNWNEAINVALAEHGFRPGQITVIATPDPAITATNEGGHGQKRLFEP
jgi:hypothetical protein